MFIETDNLGKIIHKDLPPFKLEDQMAELALFAGDRTVKLVYVANSPSETDEKFAEIVSSFAEARPLLENIRQNKEDNANPWDIELDGDLMGFASSSAEEALSKTLHLCYQVALLKLSQASGASDEAVNELCQELEDEKWSYETTRHRLLHEINALN